MTDAVICTKCSKTYYNHDIKACPEPDWVDEPNIQFQSIPGVEIMCSAPKEDGHDLTFYNNGQEVGALQFRGNRVFFEGNASESAKAMFEIVAYLLENREHGM